MKFFILKGDLVLRDHVKQVYKEFAPIAHSDQVLFNSTFKNLQIECSSFFSIRTPRNSCDYSGPSKSIFDVEGFKF